LTLPKPGAFTRYPIIFDHIDKMSGCAIQLDQPHHFGSATIFSKIFAEFNFIEGAYGRLSNLRCSATRKAQVTFVLTL
jgi:hypothetical protein